MRATRGDIAAPVARGTDAAPTRARRLRLGLFMAGIQYSTPRTDATGVRASSGIRESRHAIGKASVGIPRAGAEAVGKAHSPAAPTGKTPAGASRFTGTRREKRYDCGAIPRRNP